MIEQTTVIPQVSSQAKDHKSIPESGVPKARGINGASRTINQRLSDLTNDNVMAILKADGGEEVQSTEELLYCIKEVNSKISKGEIDSQNL